MIIWNWNTFEVVQRILCRPRCSVPPTLSKLIVRCIDSKFLNTCNIELQILLVEKVSQIRMVNADWSNALRKNDIMFKQKESDVVAK